MATAGVDRRLCFSIKYQVSQMIFQAKSLLFHVNRFTSFWSVLVVFRIFVRSCFLFVKCSWFSVLSLYCILVWAADNSVRIQYYSLTS